jgi:hypothetical protein
MGKPVRGGRKRLRPAEYQRHLKRQAEGAKPDGGAMQRSLYFGSKCQKTERQRRPFKGGRVHPK